MKPQKLSPPGRYSPPPRLPTLRRQLLGLAALPLLALPLLTARASLAQPAPEPETANEAGSAPSSDTEDGASARRLEARKRFEEGVAAMTEEDFEHAKLAFQQAYALKPHPETLRNLGYAEHQTGQFVAAARHLSRYLAQGHGETEVARRRLRALVNEAERSVARLSIEGLPQQSELLVDGESVPLPLPRDTWHVAPGEHVVRARAPGWEPAPRTISVAAGRSESVDFSHVPQPAALDSEAGRPAPTAVPPPPDHGRPWGAQKTWLVLGAGALTTVSAGLAIYGHLRYAALDRELRDQRDDTRSQFGEEDPCGAGGGAGSQVCERLDTLKRQVPTAAWLGNGGLVGVGVWGAATAALWLFWPNQSPHESPALAAVSLQPWFGAGRAGGAVTASF